MLVAIWILALLLLALWSSLVWAVHLLWQLLATVSWSQALDELGSSRLPAPLDGWFGGAWDDWLATIGPWLERLGPLLQNAAEALGAAMPALLWTLWALGLLVLVALAMLATAAVHLWRRHRAGRPHAERAPAPHT